MVTTMTLVAQNNRFDSENDQRNPQHEKMNVEERVEMLTKELSLTSSQVEEVTAILEEHIKDVESKMKSNKNRGSQRDQMKSLREDYEKKMMEVLDKDQQEIFKKFNERPEREQRRSRKG